MDERFQLDPHELLVVTNSQFEDEDTDSRMFAY